MNPQKIPQAPELRVQQWIDGDGKEAAPFRLAQFEGKFKVIYCFQHWCPGCHSVGFPSLQKLVEAFEGNENIQFLAIQTVFEGEKKNTFERLAETQQKYSLKIPFGHDPGQGRSTVMEDYRTGGTPWFILIDQDGRIIFADFHINVEGAINYLKEAVE